MTFPTRRTLTLSAALLALACGPAVPPPPDAPPGMMVMVMGAGLHASWTDTFTNETGFELQRKADGEEFQLLVTLPTNLDNHHDTTVQPGVRYTYRVRAVNAGGEGAWSAEASETAPTPEPATPDAPSNLGLQLVSGTAHLAWHDNSDGEEHFELQRSVGTGAYAALATVDANVTTYVDDTISGGHHYMYRVRAVTGEKTSSWSNEVMAMP